MTDNAETPEKPPQAAAGPAAPSPRGPLAQLGQFQLVEKIGEGGMGAVYRGIQVSLNRPVAVKLLPESLAKNKSFVERFHREARAAAALNHPNIIQVFDAGEQDGTHYFAMELVDGETVAAKVERGGPMPEPEAVAVAMSVAAALQHAWTKAKLIHRDIKPENLIVTTDGMVKVCDLGLAKSVGQDSRLTVSGTMMGTPHYIAPEQARGEPDVDTRADIYSLGASLYFLLTGKPPFQADSSMAVMYKHVNDPLPDPRTLNPSLGDGVVRILKKMTAKQPADRYQDMLELYSDLERVYQGLTPTAVVRTPDSPEATLRKMQRRLRVWRVFGVIGICALAAIGWGIWKSQQQRGGPPAAHAKKRPPQPRPAAVAQAEPPAPPPAKTSASAAATPPVPPAFLAKRKAEMRERVQTLLKQQQLDAERKAEEQRKADDEAERQRAAARAANDAQLAAERAYHNFLNLWKPLIAAHNHAKAGDVVQNALNSATYAPIKPRLELHAALGDALKALDEKFLQALPSLKGKPFTLGGLSGTIGSADATSLMIETRPGVGRTFPMAALRLEERLPLLMTALGPNSPDTLVSAGLLSLAEGRPEWMREYFDKARLLDTAGSAKAAADRFEPLREAMERAPTEAAAAAALDEVQGLITAAKWQEAGTKMAIVTKQFADTATMKFAADRLQDMKETLMAAEAGPGELRAQLALNQLQQDIEAKNWKHAAATLRKLDQQFVKTDVVKNARELAAWRGLVDAHAPTGATGALPGATLRQQLSALPGVTIHPFAGRGKGKPALLADVLAKASDGDGIELDDGIYFLRGIPIGLKNISIFAKEGAMPMVVTSVAKFVEGNLHLTGSNGCWKFEGLILTTFGMGPPPDHSGPPPASITLDHGASAEFHQCVISGRRVDQTGVPVIGVGADSELLLRNCVVAAGRGVEMSAARRMRFDHCTFLGGSILWLGGTKAAKRCEVELSNNIVLADAPAGLVGDENSNRAGRAAVPPEVLKRLNFHMAHHNVVVLRYPDTLEPWSSELEKRAKAANFVALASDDPPLAALVDRLQFNFRLKPECPAVHMADDGLAAGVRWTETFFNRVATQMQSVREQVPPRLRGAQQ
ncbi:MAG: serine/threonine protein kinase [Verrucomicrobia bacterium]|nr:serine/threonine protein kinase [Verrucomicrobiota bacterium]